MGNILITDSLFIKQKHIEKLEQQGHSIIRLDKPCAKEEEIISLIKNIDGYILGGIEQITEKIIDSAPNLKAIVFTGAGYKEFIPAYKHALNKGISISNAPGGNASSVAEFTITMILSMTRKIFSLGRCGKTSFETTFSLMDKSIGIIGLGNIGLLVAKQLKSLGVGEILYYSPRRKYHLESGFGLHYVPIEEIFRKCDIVTLHTSKDAGAEHIDKSLLKLMKTGSLLVNASYVDAVDNNALFELLRAGNISAIYDAPPPMTCFNDLPLDVWHCSNSQTAFNTHEAIDTVSSMAITSMINLLNCGDDLFKIKS